MQPATLRHPETGLETLQLYAFSHGQTHLALEGYRLARAERPELPQVERILYSGPDHNGLALVAAHGELLPLSDPESIDLFRAIFCAARVHTWQKGDVLLFDNILFGHARLPGRQVRVTLSVRVLTLTLTLPLTLTGSRASCMLSSPTRWTRAPSAVPMRRSVCTGPPRVLARWC